MVKIFGVWWRISDDLFRIKTIRFFYENVKKKLIIKKETNERKYVRHFVIWLKYRFIYTHRRARYSVQNFVSCFSCLAIICTVLFPLSVWLEQNDQITIYEMRRLITAFHLYIWKWHNFMPPVWLAISVCKW